MLYSLVEMDDDGLNVRLLGVYLTRKEAEVAGEKFIKEFGFTRNFTMEITNSTDELFGMFPELIRPLVS